MQRSSTLRIFAAGVFVLPFAACSTITISGWISGSSGTYTVVGTLNSRNYWYSASTARYLWFSLLYGAWMFDSDTDVSNGVVDFLDASSQFPPSGARWYYNTASRPVITCADSGGEWCQWCTPVTRSVLSLFCNTQLSAGMCCAL